MLLPVNAVSGNICFQSVFCNGVIKQHVLENFRNFDCSTERRKMKNGFKKREFSNSDFRSLALNINIQITNTPFTYAYTHVCTRTCTYRGEKNDMN